MRRILITVFAALMFALAPVLMLSPQPVAASNYEYLGCGIGQKCQVNWVLEGGTSGGITVEMRSPNGDVYLESDRQSCPAGWTCYMFSYFNRYKLPYAPTHAYASYHATIIGHKCYD